MKRIIAICFCFLLSGCGAAKGRWYKSPEFWGTTAVIGATAFLDGQSTVAFRKRCPSCTEGNPLFGSKPSAKRVWITGIIAISAERSVVAALWNKPATRYVNFGLTGSHVLFHTKAVSINSEVCKAGDLFHFQYRCKAGMRP